MKKLFVFLALFSSLFISGCSKNVTLNLDKISNELNTLKSQEFDMQGVYSLIDESNYYSDLVDIYDFDFEEKFGFSNENIEEYSVRMNEESLNMYMILKVSDNKDEIKSKMNAYFKSIEKESKYLEAEYEGYLIFILSNENDKVLELIKSSKAPLFSNLMKLDNETVESTLNIKKEQYTEILMEMPAIIVKSNMYVIVKPTNGEKENVKNALDTYMKNLEEQWATYLPEQYELVKNRAYEEYGGYLIYVVSTNNEKVIEIIKNYKTE